VRAFDNAGTLEINNVGWLSSTDGVIGSAGGSHGTVTVDGDGSTWMNSGYNNHLYVGRAAPAR